MSNDLGDCSESTFQKPGKLMYTALFIERKIFILSNISFKKYSFRNKFVYGVKHFLSLMF